MSVLINEQGVLDEEREFRLAVLGRTLDHLGRQTYKRRDVAIVELVANCWDAGAHNVYITVPSPNDYDQAESHYVIEDDGMGMTDADVQSKYLVVGRNRREGLQGHVEGESLIGATEITHSRPEMGRKGIGKLAGFGVAKRIILTTWTKGICTKIALDSNELRAADGEGANIRLQGFVGAPPSDVLSPNGTRVTLVTLKHKAPLPLETVHMALGRRFSRRVQGEMKIFINGELLRAPMLEYEFEFPDDGSLATEVLSDGQEVRYRYGFTKGTIASRDMRGFTILAHEKTAQAPPFFFNVEGTASGQHATKYLTGEIHADYLDDNTDDDSDIVTTDRQDIDWENDRATPLRVWGEKLSRRLFREWASRKGEELVATFSEDPEFAARLAALDPPSREQLKKQLKSLAQVEANPERARDLASALIRAYEYRHFHDVIDEIDAASADPEQLHTLLSHLSDWKVLESRAVLEIVKGRLSIVDKFRAMIVNNERETAHLVGQDNMHDLIGGYPWLLNPEWQILAEEKTISKQLQKWNHEDVQDSDKRLRYDFLALENEDRLVVVEIKRSGHAVTADELARLMVYRDRLGTAYQNIYMLMVASRYSVNQQEQDNWKRRPDGDLVEWWELHARVRKYYEHYRAVLEGDLSSVHFGIKRSEVALTRHVLDSSSYRHPEMRSQGLGPQDSTAYAVETQQSTSEANPSKPGTSHSSSKKRSSQRTQARRRKRS